MRRPYTRYLVLIISLCVALGIYYSDFRSDPTPSSNKNMALLPNLNFHASEAEQHEEEVNEELAIAYEVEGKSNPSGDLLAIERSGPWRQTLIECSRTKRKLRSSNAIIESQKRELERIKLALGAISDPNIQDSITQLDTVGSSRKSVNTWKMETNKDVDVDFLTEKFVEKLPRSSVYCMGTDRNSRTCSIQNLYYNPKEKSYFLILGPLSELVGLPNVTQSAAENYILVDFASISNHNTFGFTVTWVPEGFLDRPQRVFQTTRPTVMISRFLPGNIMHVLHDDILCYYFLLKRWLYTDGETPFNPDHHLLFMDEHTDSPYCFLFKYFTKFPLRYKSRDINGLDSDNLVWFHHAVVGNTKETNWYQYGFFEPQGPIQNKTVSGHKVRLVASYLMNAMNIPLWNHSLISAAIKEAYLKTQKHSYQEIINEFYNSNQYGHHESGTPQNFLGTNTNETDKEEVPCIAIFSRLGNRLMLNEDRLALALHAAFDLPVYFVRNESMSFEEQVRILRRSIIAVGMHGSLLIMALFLPPGALLIECFPLYVPAENYTPYKTLADLDGMDLWYGAWSNSHQELNFPHPEYPALHGGILSYDKEMQTKIQNTHGVPRHLCCSDPFWLYRIYQDTMVHVSEILRDYIMVGLSASSQKTGPSMLRVIPALINVDRIGYHWEHDSRRDHNEQFLSLHLKWDPPWNVPAVESYGVWIHETYSEFQTSNQFLDLDDFSPSTCSNGELHLWIRSYYRDSTGSLLHSEWSKKLQVPCPQA